MLAETPANSDKGGWEVGVAADDAPAARAFVHDVTSGRATLSPPWWRQPGLVLMALIVVGAVVAMLVRAC